MAVTLAAEQDGRAKDTERQSDSHKAVLQRMQGQQITVGVSNIPRSAFQASVSPLSLLNFQIHLTKTPERR